MSDMMCEVCKAAVATKHYSKMIQDASVEFHRCDSCAEVETDAAIQKRKKLAAAELIPQISGRKFVHELKDKTVVIVMKGGYSYDGILRDWNEKALYLEMKGELEPTLIWQSEMESIFVRDIKKGVKKNGSK